MTQAAFIGIDWGTTNRRSYVMAADGTVLRTERDDRGLRAVPNGKFAQEAAAIRARLGDLPMLCAGMVGSVKGWAAAPYVPCPADLEALASRLTWVEMGRTAIVPGVSLVNPERSDVMRGEEVQLLGAVVAGLVPPDALLCQPGTHCKWAWMEAGAIGSFRTSMTGELFALLRNHSLLSDYLGAPVAIGDAFRSGLQTAAKGTLLGSLFGERAAALLGQIAPDDIAAHTSGLLIGSDVREQAIGPDDTVYILSDPALGAFYGTAIEQVGAKSQLVDSHAAFAAGIAAIWRHIQ